MSRLSYECDNATKSSDDPSSPKPFPCAPDKYCFYCCCNPQCCFVINRKQPKHFWEAWYFWVGVALLVIIIASTVGTYIASNWKENLQNFTSGGNNNQQQINSPGERNASTSGPNDLTIPADRNEVSINIIPTSAVVPTHKKILLVAPPPSCAYLTPIVA